MLKVLILSVIILALAVIGLSLRMIFNKKDQYRVGCCNTAPGLKDEGYGCACRADHRVEKNNS